MKVKIVSGSGRLPRYETPGSAGMDLRACLEKDLVLEPGDWAAVPTGISIALPEGFEAQVRGRSGLAVKHGVGLVNGVGTIDSDYRGEIKVPVINWGKGSFTIRDGDRIAQLVVSAFVKIEWEPAEDLEETVRGAGGFGHTGLE
ncbi:MAG: dUTP diphosphatase [Bacillota bacterium]|nr:dUTP diphosphatase [Bacillota bacterium]